MSYDSSQLADFNKLHIPNVCLEPAELKIFDEIIEKHRSRVCLEWGSGYSTLYFPWKHKCIEQWISIEHNKKWYDLLKDRVSKKVDLRLVPVGPERALQSTGCRPYVFNVFKDKQKFDLIYVDGIYRGVCMFAASRLLKRGTGRCIFHDTGRSYYHNWFPAFDHNRKLTDGVEPDGKGGYKHRGMHVFWND